jgi:very-short-patch-repair endonuclease
LGYDEETVELLKDSRRKLGEISSILVDKETGDVIVGRHRAKAGWKSVKELTVEEKEKFARELNIPKEAVPPLIRIHSNIQRDISVEERKSEVLEFAKTLEGAGVKAEDISAKLSQLLPFSDRYIQKLLPEKYKVREKVEAGKKGAELSSAKSSEKLEEKPKISIKSAEPLGPQTQYTEAEQALAKALSRHRIKYEAQVEVLREGEYTEENKPKTYILDFLVFSRDGRRIALEVYGEGSGSLDEERTGFLKGKGFEVILLPNEMVEDYSDVLADVLKTFCETIGGGA